jgi:predicted nucleic acid-binding protein
MTAARFVDTSFLLALVVSSDQDHAQAQAWFDRWGNESWQVITTEAILTEFLNALSKPASRLLALKWLDFFRQEPTVEIISVDTGLFEQAVQLYRARPDKAWGLTDCISFVVMNQRRSFEALTVDHHFEQAGFQALLLNPG